MRRFLAVAALAVAAIFAMPAYAAENGKPHRVAIQVDQNDPALMNLALNNVSNLMEYYHSKGEQVQIEVVAYGPGLHMLREDKSPVKDRLKHLRRAAFPSTVNFSACRQHPEGHGEGGRPSDPHRAAGDGCAGRRRAPDRVAGTGLELYPAITEVNVKRIILAAALSLVAALPARAEDGIVTYKSIAPDVAFDLARAALNKALGTAPRPRGGARPFPAPPWGGGRPPTPASAPGKPPPARLDGGTSPRTLSNALRTASLSAGLAG